MNVPSSITDARPATLPESAICGAGLDSLETRRSLLTRLKDLNDQAGWRDFFDRYWRLIYNVARKSGLSDADAQDIVQATMASLAGQEGGVRHDPQRGKFRSFLLTVVRRRVVDFWRKRGRQQQRDALGAAGDLDMGEFDAMWDREWQQSLMETALARVAPHFSARQLQLFELSVVQGVAAAAIKKRLGVTMTQIYMARFRVGNRVKSELQALSQEA